MVYEFFYDQMIEHNLARTSKTKTMNFFPFIFWRKHSIISHVWMIRMLCWWQLHRFGDVVMVIAHAGVWFFPTITPLPSDLFDTGFRLNVVSVSVLHYILSNSIVITIHRRRRLLLPAWTMARATNFSHRQFEPQEIVTNYVLCLWHTHTDYSYDWKR